MYRVGVQGWYYRGVTGYYREYYLGTYLGTLQPGALFLMPELLAGGAGLWVAGASAVVGFMVSAVSHQTGILSVLVLVT